jgi:hypothetical protein
MSKHHWQDCAICGTATQYAICGNRLLSRWDVRRLPPEYAPTVTWRCELHWHYRMRAATAVQVNAPGDLIYLLTCLHKVCWVYRGKQSYTPAMIECGIKRRQIRLDQLQRCYWCADLEEESESYQ